AGHSSSTGVERGHPRRIRTLGVVMFSIRKGIASFARSRPKISIIERNRPDGNRGTYGIGGPSLHAVRGGSGLHLDHWSSHVRAGCEDETTASMALVRSPGFVPESACTSSLLLMR